MRRITLLLLFCACVSTVLTAQTVATIDEAIANYNYEEALELIDASEPSLQLSYQKARVLKNMGQAADALRVYEEIARQDTLPARSLYPEMAECYQALGKPQEVLDCYRKAVELYPANKYLRIRYIRGLLNQQYYPQALKESDALAAADSSLTVLQLQAASYEGVGATDQAEASYQRIRQLYPGDYLSAAKLGALFIAKGEWDKAIEVTEQYREHDPDNLLVNRQNAQAYCLNADYDTAINRYEWLTEQGDSTFQTCYYGGISYYGNTKDYYSACTLLKKALQYDPNNINLLYYLGRSCSNTLWKDEGIAYLKRAIELIIPADSAVSRLYMGLADCYKMAEKYPEQIETMKERYARYDPTNHRLLYNIASVYYWQLKDNVHAEQYVREFLKTRPKNLRPQQLPDDMYQWSFGSDDEYYKAAERWLEEMELKRKVENFFQGKN